MITRIHVNQHIIRSNAKGNDRLPPLTVKDYKKNRKAWTVDIHGPSRVVYSPDKPLPCGAKVWIETDSEVEVTAELEQAEADNIMLIGRIEELEAKLAKAVEALEGVRSFVRDLALYADQGHTIVPALEKACTILKELKGQ